MRPARSARGTPRRLLELQPDARHKVGVQFDRYTALGVVVDLAGRVVAQRAMPGAGDRDPGDVLAEYATNIEALLADSGVPRDGVLGIGLATHGPQDREAGVLLTDYPAPQWRGYPLAAELAEATGLPVRIENDATARHCSGSMACSQIECSTPTKPGFALRRGRSGASPRP